jgi:hypothetical protein
MARQSNEEFQQEANHLVIEITKVLSQRYPKGTEEYAFHILSASATIIANILADLDDPKVEDAIHEQIVKSTLDFKRRKETGEKPDYTGNNPNIN